MSIFLAEGEQIRPIPGLDGRYSVTSHGRVFSHVYRHRAYTVELAQARHPEGYMRVKLSAMNADSPTPVHRLVALAFHANPDALPQVNHIDGNKGNNRAENLEWVSNAGNQQHAFRIGLQVGRKGERHPGHKLKQCEVEKIRRRLNAASYRGQLADLGREFGVTLHCIFDIKHGRAWGHVA